MTQVIVRYRVKPERGEENVGLIKAVMAELHERKPAGLSYAAFVAEDGVTFFHVAFIEAENPLQQLDSFKAFVSDISDRCDEAPVAAPVSEIGSFNFPR